MHPLTTLKNASRARLPSKSESGRCGKRSFRARLPSKVPVEDVKTTLSCETCLKKCKLKMCKRSFGARYVIEVICDSVDIVIVVIIVIAVAVLIVVIVKVVKL